MRLYNTDTSPVVVGHWTNPAVLPGEAGEFDEDTAVYLLSTGRWSQRDPRAGLEAELTFKQKRDGQAKAQAAAQTPAVPDDKGATE